MKLNTDIGRLVKGKKETYPTKKRMNLYFKVDRTTAPATAPCTFPLWWWFWWRCPK